MKILRIISSINPEGGGPIEGIRRLHEPMCALGWEVDIVCCDTPNAPWVADSGLSTVICLGPSYLGYAYTPKLLPWLRAHAAYYDAVIVTGIWQYPSFAVWRAISGTRTPYYVFTHGMLDPWFKHTYRFKHFKKWLYWPWAEYRVLRDARRVIFTCEEEKLLARESFWLYKVNEAVTSYGTSSPTGDPAMLKEVFLASQPSLRGRRLLLFLSRIQEKKGCDLLIEAFATVAAQHPRLHLVMAGPDQSGWQATLQEQAARLGIAGRITWTGMLQADLKWGAFYASEVFCLSSHQENFGIVVAEALACGKPVLISNKVNIWREIEADKAGFVDTDTVDGTLRNLMRWLSLSAQEYDAMSERAVATFKSRFHIDEAAQRLMEIVWNVENDI